MLIIMFSFKAGSLRIEGAFIVARFVLCYSELPITLGALPEPDLGPGRLGLVQKANTRQARTYALPSLPKTISRIKASMA